MDGQPSVVTVAGHFDQGSRRKDPGSGYWVKDQGSGLVNERMALIPDMEVAPSIMIGANPFSGYFELDGRSKD